MAAERRLNECMKKLGVTTDYKLAEKLGIRQARISAIRKGKEKPDLELCFKMGDILGISPAVIIAEIQLENAKTPAKAMIFKHFLTAVGLWIILAVIPVSSGTFLNSAHAAGNNAETRMDLTYTPIMRSARRLKKAVQWLLNLLKNERYFTCNWHVKFS